VARNATSGNGGGIFVVGDGGVLTVKDSAVRRNVAGSDGGGLFAGTATLTNCTLSGNSAVVFGGGVWATAATLTNCTVSSNAAHGITGSGGGIGANVVTLTGCTVSGNTAADDGGGIFAVTATLTNSTVSGNSAFAGGGLFAGTATLTNSTVSGNVALASNGGGIHAATANLTNTTVAGNTAGSSGGGVWATAATLVNDTVADNIAHTGGGLFHNPGGTFNVQNTIVALNLIDFGGAGPDVSGAFTSLGHNLIGDGTGSTSFTNGLNSDIVGTAANPIDPKLGALRNNGGRTMTMALLAGSPAIDHGDNTVTLASDQRGIGIARKKDGNGDGIAVVDVGAFER
ncbi:MAG TPA: choice-of-anchor Q domain-containing protein, partial [Gemmataceae bacterium]|nr:choice-of-anchor Q domain-containing protein [Gemmataceae bacterium]